MIEYKQGVIARLPVVLIDESGNPVTGTVFSAVQATLRMSDGSYHDATPADAGKWLEPSTGTFSGSGYYELLVPAIMVDVPGLMSYIVDIGDPTVPIYRGAVKVVANEESDTYLRLGAPTGASVSEDIADVGAMTERMLNITEGRWKLDKVAKQLILYEPDGVTELRRFNTFNDTGSPDVESIFERVPV